MQGVSLSDKLRFAMSTFSLCFIMCKWVEKKGEKEIIVLGSWSIRKVLLISLFLGKHQLLNIPTAYLNIFQDPSYRLY